MSLAAGRWRCDAEPPAGLARSTLALVAQVPTSKPRSILDYVPVRVPFRWADFAVAATIFIAGVLTLVPADPAVAGADEPGRLCVQPPAAWPEPGPVRLAQPLLSLSPSHQAGRPRRHVCRRCFTTPGCCRDLSILDCPYNGLCPDRRDRPAQLRPARTDSPHRPRAAIATCSAGTTPTTAVIATDSGRPGPLESRPAMAIPVVADQPAHENYVRILEGNSPNHATVAGQNVLYSDGSVRLHRTPADQPQRPRPVT